MATVYNTGDFGPWPDIDYGGDNLYAVYDKTDPAHDTRDIYVRRSTSLGSSWDPEIRLSNMVDDEFHPRVAATNGGGAGVIGFNRHYLPPIDEYDVEAYTTADNGVTWLWSILPYNDEDEWQTDFCVSPSYGKIHAAFWRNGNVIYTWADHTTPWNWSPAVDVNDTYHASWGSNPAITVNPTKTKEACIAWSDFRDWTDYLIYFDALYLYGPAADGGSAPPPESALSLQSYP
ncbi:MAG: hypothetical protein GY778_15220, partial [bacterium]|nr:hypothetical protein [bacterium]